MTKIVKLNEQSVTPVEDENPYTDYGKAAAKKPQLILGDMMRFVKGEYLVGKKDVMPDDTEATAAMQVFYVGWTKWINNKPVAQIMVRVGSGLKPPKRKTLGDMDSSQWPTNKRGEPENPWRWTVYLPLITRAGAVYTFTSNTNGGRTATGELCKHYGKRLKDHPNLLPVVKLGHSRRIIDDDEIRFVDPAIDLATNRAGIVDQPNTPIPCDQSKGRCHREPIRRHMIGLPKVAMQY
jgi:hypothetical protein